MLSSAFEVLHVFQPSGIASFLYQESVGSIARRVLLPAVFSNSTSRKTAAADEFMGGRPVSHKISKKSDRFFTQMRL
jgi:hypothetical protein